GGGVARGGRGGNGGGGRRGGVPCGGSAWPPARVFTQWRRGTVPASRALLRSRIRGGKWWVRPPAARFPPELSASLGFFFAHRRNDLRRPLRPQPFTAPVVLPARDLTCSCEPASPVQGSCPDPPSRLAPSLAPRPLPPVNPLHP